MLKTEGIVLKEMRYRDTSKILSIYTRKYGKVTVMARGAYKPRSQIMANTQPFSFNEYNLYRGKSFYYLNQGYIIDSFYSIRDKVERVAFGQYMLELMEKSLSEEQENEKLFMLLLKGLQVLSTLEKDFLKFIVAYELKFVSFLGYRPFLDKCVICGRVDDKYLKYSIKEGGIICSNCFSLDQNSIPINYDILKGMESLLYTSLDKLGNINITKEVLNKLHLIIVDYILYNIERKKFNSLNIIETLEHINI